ncbi:unnamed protein product [Closterium sp. NIES-54]
MFHTQHRCFSRLDDAWRGEFGDEAERLRWAELLRSGVAIFDLGFDVILAVMYALSASAEGECYLCVRSDPGIEAAALGASESVLPGTAPAEALLTFTLHSGASRCFFHDSTTLTPLSAPVPVRLADPSKGLVLARSSTMLPCPAVPSSSLSGLHLHSFSTNLVNTTALQDTMVTTTTPGGQLVSICTCTRTSHHLVTFTPRPRSSLYTVASEPSQVAGSAQVSVSGLVTPPYSCRLQSHQTLLWHHRLGHPSLPRLRGRHSGLLVSGLPWSLPPLPPSHAPPYLPCVEGWQRAAPHSSSFPSTSAPLQALHMDVWGPARVSGQGSERYFLLVVDDFTRYTMVFPLHSEGQVVDVLISWIRRVCLQLRERFNTDLPVLRLHSDRGDDFSSDLLRDFCHGEGILHGFTLPNSPQKNGIAERRIGLVMEVARTSMINAAAPHFLWPFAVRYAGHQLNLWPRVSLLETLSTLRWTGKVGDAWVFRVWGSRAFVRDTSLEKLSARAIPCGPAPSCVSLVDLLPGTAPVEVAVGSGAAPGAAYGGAESGGAASEGVEPGGTASEGAESRDAEPRTTVSCGGPEGASPRLSPRSDPLSPQQLCEWFAQRTRLRSGAAGAGDSAAGDTGAGGAGVTAGAIGPGGARTGGSGAAETRGVGGAGARDPTEPGVAGAGGAGAVGTGAGSTDEESAGGGGAGAVLGVPSSSDQSLLPLQATSPLLAPSPYTEQTGGLTSVMSLRLVLPPLFALDSRPSSAPPSCLRHTRYGTSSFLYFTACSSTVVTNPSFESTAASALVVELIDFAATSCLDYATALVAESESASPPSDGGECALGMDVLEDRQEDFECLAAAVPRFASMLLALRSYAEAIMGPYSSQWQAAMDAHMASWKSTGTYIDAVPPSRANIGFTPSTADPSLFLRTDTSLPPFYVLVYVDDLVFATGDTEALTFVKLELQKRHLARCTITLTQSHMVHQVLQRFGFQFSLPQPTPLSTGHSLSAPPSNESVEPSGPYPELVGCLMYLMTCTRPDLAYPLSLLARYVASKRHRKVHWDAAKSVLRYLCSTSGIVLVLGGWGPVVLTGHADSSWADDSATQRSSQGYTFSLGAALAHLPADKLGRAASFASSSVLRQQGHDCLVSGAQTEHQTKHIALQYFLARELQLRGQLCLAYVATRANTADLFTKALPLVIISASLLC